MAGSERKITVTFDGKDVGLGRAADKAAKDVEGASENIDRAGGKFGKFGTVATGASLAVVGAAGAIGVSSYKLSQDLTKMDAKSTAVFEGSLPSMQAWADANKKSLGQSRDQVVGLAAGFADLIKPMGFTAEQAAGMSQQVIGLSGALASWSGGKYDAAQVSDILSKAMLGERDGLKALGISISDDDVKTRLAAEGKSKLTGKELEQAKALATQQLIMEKSTDAQAAWANGGKAAAEQQNASKVTTEELRESLARGLTPAFQQGTKIVAEFSGWAEKHGKIVAIGAGVVLGLAGAVLAVNAVTAIWGAITGVVTVAQMGLNLALSLNPIGLVVIAIAALVGGFILAYKHSETFRLIVNSAWEAVKTGAAWVGRAVGDIIDWFSKIAPKIGGALSGLADAITQPFRDAFNAIKWLWNNTIGGKNLHVPGIPGVWSGVDITIPKLAKGGLAFGPSLALVGDNPGASTDPEVIAPLSKLQGMGQVTLVIDSAGSQLDDLLVQVLRKAITNRGGINAVFG